MEDITGWDGRVWCGVCLHDRDEHDGMGDCHRPDRRTKTGYCNAHEKARKAT